MWSGPDTPGVASRDTAVVVRHLFQSARRSVLVASFAVYQGERLFRVLAERLDAEPELHARLVLNVARETWTRRRTTVWCAVSPRSSSPGSGRVRAGPRYSTTRAGCSRVDRDRAPCSRPSAS